MENINLKNRALKNMKEIYGDTKGFDSCWSQLTDEEKVWFTYNQCYFFKNHAGYGPVQIYFHCYNNLDDCWHDYDLEDFRELLKKRDFRNNVEIYNCMDGSTIYIGE